MPRRKRPYSPNAVPFWNTSGPDWVYQLAQNRVEKRQQARVDRDGPDVVRCMRFLRARRDGEHKKAYRDLAKSDPDIVAAWMLYHGNPRYRLELEGRFLARQCVGAIAVELGTAKTVVETYRDIFYHVTDRLGALQFILYRVLGLTGDQPATAEQMVLMQAHQKGPHGLTAWLDWYDSRHEPCDLATPEGRQREQLSIMFAIHQLSDDEKTSARCCKWLPRVAGQRKKLFQRKTASTSVQDNVVRLMSETFATSSAETHSVQTDVASVHQPSESEQRNNRPEVRVG